MAFFLMLILTETPMNLSLIGSGVATLITGTYLGLVLMGKPLKTISTNIDKLTSGKRAGYFIGLMIVNLSVCGVLLTMQGIVLMHTLREDYEKIS